MTNEKLYWIVLGASGMVMIAIWLDWVPTKAVIAIPALIMFLALRCVVAPDWKRPGQGEALTKEE